MRTDERSYRLRRGGRAEALPIWKWVLDPGLILLFLSGLVSVGFLIALMIKLGSPGPVGVTIGGAAMRGAGARVIKDVPLGGIVPGNLARIACRAITTNVANPRLTQSNGA